MMKLFQLSDMREQYQDLILEAEYASRGYEAFLVRLLSVEEERKQGRRMENFCKEAWYEAGSWQEQEHNRYQTECCQCRLQSAFVNAKVLVERQGVCVSLADYSTHHFLNSYNHK